MMTLLITPNLQFTKWLCPQDITFWLIGRVFMMPFVSLNIPKDALFTDLVK